MRNFRGESGDSERSEETRTPGGLTPIQPFGRAGYNDGKCKGCGAAFPDISVFQRYCPLCQEKMAAEARLREEENLQRQAEALRRRWLEQESGIPQRFWPKRIGDLAGKHVEAIKGRAALYAGLLDVFQGAPSLALCGHERGTGKTHLAIGIAQEIMDARLRGSQPGPCPVLFTTATIMFRRIRATYRDGAQESELSILEELERVGLLILDDVGQEKASDHTRETYYSVINLRYNADRPILMTSNLVMPGDIRAFTELMGDAALSRLTEMIGPNWIHIEGKDYRRGVK